MGNVFDAISDLVGNDGVDGNGTAGYDFTQHGTKWKWSKTRKVWEPQNALARKVARTSTQPLKTADEVRALVNRYGLDGEDKRRETTSEGTLTIRSVLQDIGGLSGGELDLWAAIAIAESGGDCAVVNFIGCVGLFQINQPVHNVAHKEWTREWLKNYANNIAAAKILSNGWTNKQPWEAYTNGAYKKFLGQDRKLKNAGPNSRGPGNSPSTADTIVGGVQDTVADVGSVLGQLVELASVLFNSSTWFRIGKVLIGAILLIAVLIYVVKFA